MFEGEFPLKPRMMTDSPESCCLCEVEPKDEMLWGRRSGGSPGAVLPCALDRPMPSEEAQPQEQWDTQEKSFHPELMQTPRRGDSVHQRERSEVSSSQNSR